MAPCKKELVVEVAPCRKELVVEVAEIGIGGGSGFL